MIGEILQSMILLGEASSASSDSVYKVLVLGLGGLAFWFLRDKLIGLATTDGEIKRDLRSVKKTVGAVITRLMRIEGKLGIGPLTIGSPLELNDNGRNILNNSGIKEAVEENRETLLRMMKEKTPETAYDVQKLSQRFLQECEFSSQRIKQMKEYAFEHPNWDLDVIREVGAIHFRDIALEELEFEKDDLNGTTPESPE